MVLQWIECVFLGRVHLVQYILSSLTHPHLLTEQQVQGFILDLRNNPGGLVKSGLEVARLWMDGEAPIFNLTGRKAVGVW